MTKDERVRLWATVVYPESAPDNWLSVLSDLMIPCYVSPLHDRDLNADNTPKKPHYHVFMIFDGKKSRQQIKEIVERFGGVGQENIISKRGYARYLCHLDNPEKAQYDPEQVRSLCGADYHHTIGLAIDKYKAIREMMHFCKEYSIIAYSDLLEYCA